MEAPNEALCFYKPLTRLCQAMPDLQQPIYPKNTTQNEFVLGGMRKMQLRVRCSN